MKKTASFLLSLGLLGSACAAETFPEQRPIEFVVGLAAGGQGDITARLIGRHLEKQLKTPVIVLNKPGASQMVGAAYVARAKPDGHTIGQLTNAIITAELTGMSNGYKMDELRAVCQISGAGTVLAVSADSPLKTYQDFVTFAKGKPGVTAGHQGNGSANHTRLEILSKHAQLGLSPIPFKGEAEAVNQLMGKHVEVAAISPVVARPLVQSGKLRVLAAWEESTVQQLDQKVPSLEAVYGKDTLPDIDISLYLWIPKKTPESTVRALDKACQGLVNDPEFGADFAKSNIPVIHLPLDKLEADMAAKLKSYREALKLMGTLKP